MASEAGWSSLKCPTPSQIAEAAEPFFLSYGAEVELVPVMNADDLRKGLATAAPN